MDFRSNAFMVFGMDKASVDVDGGKDCGDVVRNNHRCSSSKTSVWASKELKEVVVKHFRLTSSVVYLRHLIASG